MQPANPFGTPVRELRTLFVISMFFFKSCSALASDPAARVWALGENIVLCSSEKNFASLHPGVLMGTGEFNAWGNSAMD